MIKQAAGGNARGVVGRKKSVGRFVDCRLGRSSAQVVVASLRNFACCISNCVVVEVQGRLAYFRLVVP